MYSNVCTWGWFLPTCVSIVDAAATETRAKTATTATVLPVPSDDVPALPELKALSAMYTTGYKMNINIH